MTALVTIVLPYFNEQDWIGATVDSLVTQTDRRFHLLLIDNRSVDDSPMIARWRAMPLGDAVSHMACETPGKIYALADGLQHVSTPYVAICDADTLYPPGYVARIITHFERNPAAAAVMAIDLYAPANSRKGLERSAHIVRKSQRFPGKCHAGGYAQAFCADVLRRAGGVDANRWPYVLEDHEVVHRIMPYGTVNYHPDHVCFPSGRRRTRKSISWTPMERLVYRHTPPQHMDWYFYDFLGPRLAARNSYGTALREKDWSIPTL